MLNLKVKTLPESVLRLIEMRIGGKIYKLPNNKYFLTIPQQNEQNEPNETTFINNTNKSAKDRRISLYLQKFQNIVDNYVVNTKVKMPKMICLNSERKMENINEKQIETLMQAYCNDFEKLKWKYSIDCWIDSIKTISKTNENANTNTKSSSSSPLQFEIRNKNLIKFGLYVGTSKLEKATRESELESAMHVGLKEYKDGLKDFFNQNIFYVMDLNFNDLLSIVDANIEQFVVDVDVAGVDETELSELSSIMKKFCDYMCKCWDKQHNNNNNNTTDNRSNKKNGGEKWSGVKCVNHISNIMKHKNEIGSDCLVVSIIFKIPRRQSSDGNNVKIATSWTKDNIRSFFKENHSLLDKVKEIHGNMMTGVETDVVGVDDIVDDVVDVDADADIDTAVVDAELLSTDSGLIDEVGDNVMDTTLISDLKEDVLDLKQVEQLGSIKEESEQPITEVVSDTESAFHERIDCKKEMLLRQKLAKKHNRKIQKQINDLIKKKVLSMDVRQSVLYKPNLDDLTDYNLDPFSIDLVDMKYLKGIGPQSLDTLQNVYNLNTIDEISNLTQSDIVEMKSNIRGLKSIVNNAKQAISIGKNDV